MPDCDCIPINNSNVLNGLHIMTEQQKQVVEEYLRFMLDKPFDNKEIEETVHYNLKKGMQEVINNPEKYGLQPINEWVSVKDRLPMAWEVGNWDGKRTDEVLIRKTDGKYAVGRMYTGVIDGVEFSDWSEGREEWLINTKDITHWKPINEREEG